MKAGTVSRYIVSMAAGLLMLGPANLQAAAPTAADLKAAVESGSLTAYFDNLTKFLGEKVPLVPNGPSIVQLKTLFKDPAVCSALLQRTFLQKGGVANLENFAKANPGNKAFLLWILQNPQVMDTFLIGAAPIALRHREDNSFGFSTGTLDIWKKIYDADPESRQGLYLKLAMADGLNPPGTGCRGAGQPEKQDDPLTRYFHFKNAHRNRQLVPSFDRLEVWELRHVTCSMASDADLKWGRDMVNTWNPGFKNNELVVDTTSQVWRRNSPISHAGTYRNVMAGGGKCGPRSSWSVFICQAWGVPATGVAQPAHAAVAFRRQDGIWSTAYGRSFAASRLLGTSGNEFYEGMVARQQKERFALCEHMRWLALALPAAMQTPILELAKDITKAPPEINVPYDRLPTETTVLKAMEAPKDTGDKYVARMRGFLYPPATGNYAFRIASDDSSDLFLSTDTNPEAKKLIAYTREWTEYKEFGKFPTQTSAPIRLEGGKAYYIEAVHQEDSGGDHVEVAWIGPGVMENIISGVYLSPYKQGAEKGSIFREVWMERPAVAAPVAAAKPAPAAAPPTPPPAPVFSPVNGVIHVDAAGYFDNGGCAVFGGHPGVNLMDSYPPGTGKQIHFAANMGTVYAGYKINVPQTGMYDVSAKIATVNFDQSLVVKSYGSMYTPKSATASHVWHNMVKDLGGDKACDGNPATRWAVNEGTEQCTLEVDLGAAKTISTCQIDERFFNRISKFKVEYKSGSEWKTLFEDQNIGIVYSKDFPPVTAQYVRLCTLDGRENGGPTIWEFSVGQVKDGVAWMGLPCTYGLWGMSKPVEIRLVKGPQTIWFMAPFQRGVTMKSFDLRFKSATTPANYLSKVAPVKSIPSSQLKNAAGEDPEVTGP